MLYWKHLINFSFLLLFTYSVSAQKTEKEYSPKRASIYSAVVPGAGQFYNKKYWKIPLVWGAIGTSAYYINYNTVEFKSYKNALIARNDDDPGTVDYTYPDLSDELVEANMDYYRRLRDISYFALAASYILNIVDASVDAHLKGFDVKDDLHLGFTSTANKMTLSPGLSLTYHF
tara:strand:+ start:79516 stop:80037 length:522 start_codon:yes stop_codon:yes gene_type:complete